MHPLSATNYRYRLETYHGPASRYVCPQCNKREKTFVRYIDTQTGQHLGPHVGRCNRESNCGYHLTPTQFFQANQSLQGKKALCFLKSAAPARAKYIPPEISYIDKNILFQSLKAYQANNFVIYLHGLFGAAITQQLIEQYVIGTSGHWPGATVFWQIDTSQQVRSGKILLYNAATGKRVKQPFSHITWAHRVLKLPAFNLQQCFFGQHLLRYSNKPIALVESEKTAIIASVYLPQHTWLATGSLSNLSPHRCSVLKGKKVTLFPDINGYEKWSDVAAGLQRHAHFVVSDLLEQTATAEQKQQGLDLADYLVQYDWKKFCV